MIDGDDTTEVIAMRRTGLAFLIMPLLALVAPNAVAEPSGGPAVQRSCVVDAGNGTRRTLTASALFERTWNWRGNPPDTPVLPMVPARRDHPAAAAKSVTEVEFANDLLTRMLPGVKDTNRLTFIAAANPDGAPRRDLSKEPDADNRHPEAQGILVTATQSNASTTRLRLSTPPIRTVEYPPPDRDAWWNTLSRGWRYVVAICNSDTDELLGFATFTQEVRSNVFGQVVKYAVLAGFWMLTVLIAYRLHHTLTTRLWHQGNPESQDPPSFGWRIGRAINPIFIAQDAAGSGSLAKIQLLFFTGVVVAIVAQAWYATDTLPAFSITVLALLGITSAGSVLSRAASGGALAAANRAWLVGRGVLSSDPRMPKLTDLFGTEGEIDITRLQALCFSAYVLIALLTVAPVDIPTFEVPEQFLYLMGLSQGVYVAGRTFTPEAVRRLNEDLERLRKAERDWMTAAEGSPAREQAKLDFDTAREAAAVSLDATTEGDKPADALRHVTLPPRAGPAMQGGTW
ncbi:MAG: hypothetical protein ACOYOH_05980 [Paracraurococcus sp.]